jgi:hypothetical protein
MGGAESQQGAGTKREARLAEARDEILDLRTTMRSDRAQLRTDILSMLEQPVLDRNKANTIVDQQLAKLGSQSPAIIDAIGNFYDSLDDTQRAELREFIEHKINHHHWHRHWH